MPSEAEQKYLLLKEEYSLVQKAFYDIRTRMPADKRLRSLSQKSDYEYARIQVSNAAKRLRDAEIAWRSEELFVKEAETEEAKERFGTVSDPKFQEMARIMLEGIEKGRRKA